MKNPKQLKQALDSLRLSMEILSRFSSEEEAISFLQKETGLSLEECRKGYTFLIHCSGLSSKQQREKDVHTAINVRPLTEQDIEAVFFLEKECFPDPWSQKSLRDTLREDRCCMLAAEAGDTLCGYLNATYLFEELNLNRIAVLPAFRRQGVGSALLQTLVDFCTERRLTRLTLEVRASNLPAQRLYESFGFHPLGQRKNFYQNPPEPAVIMEKINAV